MEYIVCNCKLIKQKNKNDLEIIHWEKKSPYVENQQPLTFLLPNSICIVIYYNYNYNYCAYQRIYNI